MPKLVMRNQEVLVSPLDRWLDATEYLMSSRPVDVACISGVLPSEPIIEILAKGRAGVLLKVLAN